MEEENENLFSNLLFSSRKWDNNKIKDETMDRGGNEACYWLHYQEIIFLELFKQFFLSLLLLHSHKQSNPPIWFVGEWVHNWSSGEFLQRP